MSDLKKGRLVWTADRKLRRVVFPTKSGGDSPPTAFDAADLDARLRGGTEDVVEVELELVGGKPRRIRPVGEAFQANAPPPPPRQPQGQRPPQSARPAAPPGEFHNPYNFVPAPPRDPRKLGELGDRPPTGHDRYAEGHFSGVIRVRLTTVTPLLLPDAAAATENKDGHKTYPVRVGPDGRPLLPPTTVKGALRAAFEAVTNSRLGVFAGHGRRLAYRRQAKVEVQPARVEADGESLVLRLMGVPVMIPSYDLRSGDRDRGRRRVGLRYPSGGQPAHRDHVWVRIRNGMYVDAIRPHAGGAPGPDWYEGYVCVNNANIKNKRSERVFIVQGQDETIRAQGAEAARLRALWNDLIQDYQDTHVRDLAQRRERGDEPFDYLGDVPGRTAWSRHVYTPADLELTEGTLCYARRDRQGRITGLYPVAISRDLFESSPSDLLPEATNLRASQNLEALSPAERTFGWARQGGHGAYRGQLRVGPVACASADALVTFPGDGLPLAILGQPKPQQARFYVAADEGGRAQADGLSKEVAGYRPGQGLRGRKVYPHHTGLPEGHWADPTADRTQTPAGRHHQEYRRPRLNGQEQRDDQNRSTRGWVRAGAEFAFDLHVINLSRVELGALLWLLELPPGHFHRVGGGKPLGFGSARLDIDWDRTALRDGAAKRLEYETLDATPAALPVAARGCVADFRRAAEAAYGQPFEQVPFVAAFLRAAAGFADGLPVHYPRGPVAPHPEGRAYEWFTANEREGQQALPNLVDDRGLPLREPRGLR